MEICVVRKSNGVGVGTQPRYPNVHTPSITVRGRFSFLIQTINAIPCTSTSVILVVNCRICGSLYTNRALVYTLLLSCKKACSAAASLFRYVSVVMELPSGIVTIMLKCIPTGYEVNFEAPNGGLVEYGKPKSAQTIDWVKRYHVNVGNALTWKTSNLRVEHNDNDDILKMQPRLGYADVPFARKATDSIVFLLPVDHNATVAIGTLTLGGKPWAVALSTFWKNVLSSSTELPNFVLSKAMPAPHLIYQAARRMEETLGVNHSNLFERPSSPSTRSTPTERFYVPLQSLDNAPSNSLNYLTKAFTVINGAKHIVAGTTFKSTSAGVEYASEPNYSTSWRTRAGDIAKGWSA